MTTHIPKGMQCLTKHNIARSQYTDPILADQVIGFVLDVHDKLSIFRNIYSIEMSRANPNAFCPDSTNDCAIFTFFESIFHSA